eukprot:TRINITY_DN5819_c1_g1_i1.p1 TRINITY_DN5819_c1_g1~~TRINITY_DN5819_c1_g1_i1.p1  ORF type:complete len:345 (+),score=61.00 TRINITY_DN5819_c1_g1_i1:62-1036(+)
MFRRLSVLRGAVAQRAADLTGAGGSVVLEVDTNTAPQFVKDLPLPFTPLEEFTEISATTQNEEAADEPSVNCVVLTNDKRRQVLSKKGTRYSFDLYTMLTSRGTIITVRTFGKPRDEPFPNGTFVTVNGLGRGKAFSKSVDPWFPDSAQAAFFSRENLPEKYRTFELPVFNISGKIVDYTIEPLNNGGYSHYYQMKKTGSVDEMVYLYWISKTEDPIVEKGYTVSASVTNARLEENTFDLSAINVKQIAVVGEVTEHLREMTAKTGNVFDVYNLKVGDRDIEMATRFEMPIGKTREFTLSPPMAKTNIQFYYASRTPKNAKYTK